MAVKKTTSTNSSFGFEMDELVALARLDVEQGNLAEALSKLKQVLSEASPPPEALSMTARLYAQLCLFDRAKPLFQKFLETQPNAVNETFQFGMVHFDANQPTDAIRIWTQLLKFQPTHPPALFYCALAHHQQANPGEARRALDVLLKSAPPDNLYFNRGKELLHAIETATPVGNALATPAESLRQAPRDAYKTEH